MKAICGECGVEADRAAVYCIKVDTTTMKLTRKNLESAPIHWVCNACFKLSKFESHFEDEYRDPMVCYECDSKPNSVGMWIYDQEKKVYIYQGEAITYDRASLER